MEELILISAIITAIAGVVLICIKIDDTLTEEDNAIVAKIIAKRKVLRDKLNTIK